MGGNLRQDSAFYPTCRWITLRLSCIPRSLPDLRKNVFCLPVACTSSCCVINLSDQRNSCGAEFPVYLTASKPTAVLQSNNWQSQHGLSGGIVYWGKCCRYKHSSATALEDTPARGFCNLVWSVLRAMTCKLQILITAVFHAVLSV